VPIYPCDVGTQHVTGCLLNVGGLEQFWSRAPCPKPASHLAPISESDSFYRRVRLWPRPVRKHDEHRRLLDLGQLLPTRSYQPVHVPGGGNGTPVPIRCPVPPPYPIVLAPCRRWVEGSRRIRTGLGNNVPPEFRRRTRQELPVAVVGQGNSGVNTFAPSKTPPV